MHGQYMSCDWSDTATTTTVLWPIVWDYPTEPVPEGTQCC